MSMEESLSLEETNKIRISLGLKPLTDDKAPASDPDKQAEDNYKKVREREEKERETKRIQDRIAKVKNRRELNAGLKGATLGDADAQVDDTLSWLKRSKKKEKELAKKRQQELENMDKQFQEEYTERDLEGLKVSHDFEDMEEGEARILTLKDSRILDNEEDELQNVEMAEEERRQKNVELKKKKRDYTGYDDDEFVDGNAGMKRAVLAKYDDDLGTSETGFRLGGAVQSKAKAQRQTQEDAAAVVNKSLLSIDYAKNNEISDYLQEGDVGFKKPKAKKKRPSRRVPESSLQDGDDMAVDTKPVLPEPRNLDANFVDDDELQAALSRSRQAKLRKTKKVSPEELARRLAAQRETASPDIKMEEADGQDEETGGLTIDDTSEFVRSITYNPVTVKSEPTEPRLATPAPAVKAEAEASTDVTMKDGDVAVTELEAGELPIKEEDEEDEGAMLNALEVAMKEVEDQDQAAGAVKDLGTAAEQTFGSGLASTLNILRQQGLIAGASADLQEREQVQRQRDLWLAEQRRRVAERELERVRARGQNKDQAQREYENRMREQQEARETLEAFRDYKPDVKIEYYDEFGRTLTPKEAWKALSHKFHGKGSGKMKTEKRLKKIAEEKKQAAMASGDTPLSMQQAFQRRQEQAGQAHMVLSVGNRGAVPQAEEFLDAHLLTKSTKAEKKGKKKETKSQTPQALGADAFITLPQPLPSSATSENARSAEASPAPRAGFKRIGSVDLAANGAGGDQERAKVAFGLTAKRKADGEASGTPPPKRR